MLATNTASMFPRPPPSLYSVHADAPPPAQYHAYSMLTGFSAGSSFYGHEAQSFSAPTNLVGATGSSSTSSGYGYASYSYSPMPLFPNPPLETIPRMDISQPARRMSPLEYPLESAMAVSPPYPSTTTIDPNTASTTRSGSEYRRGSEISPGGGSPPRRRGSANKDDHSGDSKKKEHACWMCHKSFDRPSTLKKHILVHTGEKAHVCETCGRRFGVQSNLNRHAKRCPLRPVNLAKGTASTGTDASSTAQPQVEDRGFTTETRSDVSAEVPRSRKRKPATQDMTAEDPAEAQPAKSKRCRRAPSPSRWIPDSLKFFDLTPQTKSAPVPLPPVRPYGDIEERDSLDENVATAPYHPQGWTGRLPGPGVMERDIANTNGGRILIF